MKIVFPTNLTDLDHKEVATQHFNKYKKPLPGKLQIINSFQEENAQGKFNCVIVDEAHTLSIVLIDKLRSFYEERANFSLILSELPLLVNKNLNLSITIPMKQRLTFFWSVRG